MTQIWFLLEGRCSLQTHSTSKGRKIRKAATLPCIRGPVLNVLPDLLAHTNFIPSPKLLA